MKNKVESVMKALRDLSSDIDGIYTKGVVDGFTQQPLYCDYLTTSNIIMLAFTVHSHHAKGNGY